MWIAVTAALLLLSVACTQERRLSSEPDDPAAHGTSSEPEPCIDIERCTTRELAVRAGVRLGAAVGARYLDEAVYRTTLTDTFNSITPENELKWAFIHPRPGVWDFGPADRIVDFAREHGIEVKGHALIWEQELIDATPDWVLGISDPNELRRVVVNHFTTVMARYGDAVDRWDVVNEPLQMFGAELNANHFHRVLGEDYIAEMFAIAHDAAPDEELWLNEAAVEYQPAKAAALVDLVAGLVNRGVPIDGVGIQGHLLSGTVDRAALEELIARLESLGVKVAITELDVATRDPIDPLARQADTYGAVMGACLIHRCREVTLWGFTDRHTWIDQTFGTGLAPLPFDADYRPKPALGSLRAQLAAVRPTG
jgi:endo-1,4-beta-xylanase